MNSIIVKNPKGLLVEIDEKRWKSLKEMGFTRIDLEKKKEPHRVKVNPTKSFDVLVISENNNFYSGGRYYSWQLAHALAEANLSVGFYTNMRPVFEKDFEGYKPFMIILKSDIELKDIKANCYIATPVWGNKILAELETDKDKYMIVFDPLPSIKKYVPDDYDMESKYFTPMLEAIKQPGVKIITITEWNKEIICEWLNKKPSEVLNIYPVVNSHIARKTKLMAVSRVVERKNFSDLIKLLSKLPSRFELDIVTSYGGETLLETIEKYGLNSRVRVNTNLDDKKKFDLFKSCDIMVNTALFEGFGMYCIESLSLGKPVVCYEYPSFKEIKEVSKSKIVYMAKRKSVDDLVEKVLEAEKQIGFNNDWDFETMTKKVDNIFSKYKQKKIAWVADYFKNDRPGGAQLTNLAIIEKGQKLGYAIDRINTTDILKEDFKKYDLLVVNNIRMSTKEDRDLIIKFPYIRFEHDYLDYFLDKDEVKKMFGNSLANIFLSPLHLKQNQTYCKDNNNYYIPSPIDPKLFYKKSTPKSGVMWAGELGRHKGLDNVADWATKNKTGVDIYGWIGDESLLTMVKEHSFLNYKGQLSHQEMRVKLREYESFIHLPVWYEPFGRAVMEAYLSGCKLITNNKVGAMSFDWDYDNYEEVKKNLESSPDLFWEIIKKYERNIR